MNKYLPIIAIAVIGSGAAYSLGHMFEAVAGLCFWSAVIGHEVTKKGKE